MVRDGLRKGTDLAYYGCSTPLRTSGRSIEDLFDLFCGLARVLQPGKADGTPIVD